QYYLMTQVPNVFQVVASRRRALEGAPATTLAVTYRATGSKAIELWVATDHLLLVLGALDPRPSWSELDALAAPVVARLGPAGPAGRGWSGVDGLAPAVVARLSAAGPSDVVAFGALEPWLGALRQARAGLEPVTTPDWRLGSAARAWRMNDPRPCGAAFGDAL